jgi:hypothetical protein
MDSPYLGRVVTFILVPIVGGLTAWLVPWVAENFPGAPALDAQELSNIAVAGVVAFGAAVYKWLDNKGKSERGEGP